ncbi:hypothetical protein KGA66_24695 [Actinocrinis puniceicyclus]|uniref:Uncharacterized protein n=1 Tax=Actinocrinis puniceicyclus TaxID=977794 RepID=A0A8J7WTN2_9ACTN|nr:hypothetical protein [Actinocrinis puniceicyclus]MBS2966267.1 hypothetical protein [Actinocrinis puniceicyclus]
MSRGSTVRAEKQVRDLPLLDDERAEHDPHGPDTTLARKIIAAHFRRVALEPAAAPRAKRAAPLRTHPNRIREFKGVSGAVGAVLARWQRRGWRALKASWTNLQVSATAGRER